MPDNTNNTKPTYYKFRNFNNLNHVLDIFLNDRLFAAKFNSLNDPMEGVFTTAGLTEEKINEIIANKKILSICSTCNKKNINGMDNVYNILQWIHYSSAGSGFVIEFELIECEDNHNNGIHLKNIEYLKAKDFKEKLNAFKTNQIDIKNFALNLLCLKLNLFEYENEFRILKESEEELAFVRIKIKKIYAGYNISNDNHNFLKYLVDNKNNSLSEDDKIKFEKIKKNELRDSLLFDASKFNRPRRKIKKNSSENNI